MDDTLVAQRGGERARKPVFDDLQTTLQTKSVATFHVARQAIKVQLHHGR